MNYAEILSDANVVGFLLLFVRFGTLFMGVPIFSHQNIPLPVKSAMAFLFTVIFYDTMPPIEVPLNATSVSLAILSEMLFGLVIGLVLQIVYSIIAFAGGLISFAMGFSMATALDPQSGVSMPIVGTVLSLVALMVLFSLNLHHWILIYVSDSLKYIPLGGFVLNEHTFNYIISASANMLLIGFTMAFPIFALSWMSDIIFGMLMKTMPQFNLLVIGFPIKIMISLSVIIAILSSIMLLFKREVLEAFNWLGSLFLVM
ncbi:MAG: flagellar biosynthetic protein FliR [Campylobacterota bacterium]|nr:flagellar biosynthetic protein FliR [Campylobacterota bacterium]